MRFWLKFLNGGLPEQGFEEGQYVCGTPCLRALITHRLLGPTAGRPQSCPRLGETRGADALLVKHKAHWFLEW